MNFATQITEPENIQFMDDATFIIAENNDLCRLGLERIIKDQVLGAKVFTASTKLQLHSTLLSNNEAVVLIDFFSLAISSIDEVTVLSVCFPQSKWLFLADIPDETFLLPLTASFSKANFVLKANDYDVIASAILATIAGKKYFCSEALQIILAGHHRKKENSVKRNLLTTTELELVQLFTQGKTAKEIAMKR